MLIVWDEPKRLANLAKHKLDFAEVTVLFFETAIVRPVKDRRFIAIGLLSGRPISIV